MGVSGVAAKIDSVQAAEYYARRRLPKGLARRIEGGSGAGVTIRDNLAAFERVKFTPRVGVAVGTPRLKARVVGQDLRIPVLIAPTGNIRPFHPDAEPGVARAAGRAGTGICVSSVTGTAIEDIATATSGPVFFQLYYLGNRDSSAVAIDRAKKVGCAGLVVTIDTASAAPRDRPVSERTYLPTAVDLRNMLRFAPQALLKPRWLLGFARDGWPDEAPMGRTTKDLPMRTIEATTSLLAGEIPVWEDFAWIRERWQGPIIAKGILSVEDARRAVAEGADAIVVSNHGGMLFDALPPSIEVLPAIADAVGDKLDVLLDSGIRRPVDVARAIALGARAVLIGRAYLWAHAAGGEAGVFQILEVFREGLEKTLKYIGCPGVDVLDRTYLTHQPSARHVEVAR
jgi:L-lactate dehydrogenase (cytochrome)